MTPTLREQPLGRDNAEWVLALSNDGPAAEAAHRELRLILVKALRPVLSKRGVAADLGEDFAQEALVRIREKLDTFRSDSQFTTWAIAIAIRVAFDELRHKRWQDVSFDAFATEAELPLVFESTKESTVEKQIERDKILTALRTALEERLTSKQRAVLLAELNGMPHVEIALALGMKRNALYKLAHDARVKVKGQLQAVGITEAEALWIFE